MKTARLTFDFKKEFALSQTRAQGQLHFESEHWIHVVMGPSGAGKSSFARWIAGLSPQDGGMLAWNGAEWTNGKKHLSPQKRRVGFMAQGDQLFPHLTVVQNVAYGLRKWEKSKRRARLEEVMTLLGLNAMAEQRPQTLSGGEKRRVALAQVLAIDPVLLILDEPFSGLDLSFRKSLWGDLRSWIDFAALPALMITHDELEARALSDRIHCFQNNILQIL